MSNWRNILLWRMPERSKLPEPIAFYTITNWFGIGIIEMTDDWVKYAFYSEDENNYTIEDTEDEKIFEAEIEWLMDEDDEDATELKPAFKHGERIYFLNDFIRTNYGR